MDDTTKALNRDPRNVKCLIRRGLAYESLERWQEGLDDMRAALAIDCNAKQALDATGRLNRMLRLEKQMKGN